MSTYTYIFKRILAVIPLLIIVSLISFAIIRLNITIENINLSLFISLASALMLFYFLSKIKNWYFLGILSLIFFIFFAWYLSSFSILPLNFILNFIFLSFFLLIYWLQSFITKTSYLPKIVTFIALIIISFNLSSHSAINIPVNPVILKSGDPLADLRFNPSISEATLKQK